MKNILILSIILISSILSYSQGGDLNMGNIEREPCWKKSADRAGQRYVEWECGKSDSIVDCGEKLEMDPGTNAVYSKGSGSPFTGYCETCHMNGLKQRQVFFLNGKQHGQDTTYYASGCPQVVTNYLQGVENGVWTYYNDSSSLEAWQIGYLNGDKHGRAIYWKQKNEGKDAGGNTVYSRDTLKIEYYSNGLLNGTKTDYWKDSKLRKEVNYKLGVLHGTFKAYDAKGTLVEDINYSEGKKDGEFKYYYDDGSALKTENWDEGVKNGNFTVFYIQGHVQSSENYKKGRKDGWFEERFPSDKVKRKALYKKDQLIEEHVYDEYGNEIRTVGETASNAKEDDDIPTDPKAAKKAAKAKAKAEKKRLKEEAKKNKSK